MWKAVTIDAWLAARKTSLEDARATVTEIIGRVQNEGDAALRDLAKKYCELDAIAVSEEEREAAYEQVDAQVTEALVEAHARIERFHELRNPAISGWRRWSRALSWVSRQPPSTG